LEKLGFPWILSSESRLFNGLRGIFAEINFSLPFGQSATAVGTAAHDLGLAEGDGLVMGKLNSISDFPQ
jgi:hypothetical protein